MKNLVYQEVHNQVTYSLLCRIIGNVSIYDIEVEIISENGRTIETVSSVSTDCQTSMLLLELIIRQEISPNDLIRYSNAFLDLCYPI